MKTNSILLFSLFALGCRLHAGPRTSANYTIATDTADGGGRHATSASYTNDGSAGLVAGISTVTSPAETAKSGYIAQLFDITGFTLTAVSNTVNEGATDQLGAWQVLDDTTFLAVPAASVAWSVASGPLVSINASGLATAGIVYEATSDVVHLGRRWIFALFVFGRF